MPFVLAPPELRERVLGDARLVSYDADATDPLTDPHGRRVAGTGTAIPVGAALAERAGPWRPGRLPAPARGTWSAESGSPPRPPPSWSCCSVVLGLSIRPASRPTVLAGGADPGASPTATESAALPTPAETAEVADPTATGTTTPPPPTTRAAAPTPEPTPAATVVPPAPTPAGPRGDHAPAADDHPPDRHPATREDAADHARGGKGFFAPTAISGSSPSG